MRKMHVSTNCFFFSSTTRVNHFAFRQKSKEKTKNKSENHIANVWQLKIWYLRSVERYVSCLSPRDFSKLSLQNLASMQPRTSPLDFGLPACPGPLAPCVRQEAINYASMAVFFLLSQRRYLLHERICLCQSTTFFVVDFPDFVFAASQSFYFVLPIS